MDKLTIKDKKRFIMISSMLRDLNLLQKCLIYISNEKPREDPYIAANATIGFFFLKTLISKIHEMWTFLNKNCILKDYSTFSDEMKQKTDRIVEFFNKDKVEEIFAFIRDKFGFHYEYQDDVDALVDNAIKDFEYYEAWLSSENSGNEIFSSSNSIILKIVLTEMKKYFQGDERELLNKLYDLSLEGARLFRDFCVFYLVSNFQVTWEQMDEIEIEVPLISEVQLPLIVTR